MSSWDRVVVGFDGSDESEQALRWACQEAKTHGLDVVVVSTQSIPLVAIDPPFGSFPWGAGTDLPAGNREKVERAVLDTLAEYPEVTARFEFVTGHAADELVRRSAEADMVVIGAKGHGAVTGRLIGSVSQDVLANSTCMVVVVRGRGPGNVTKHPPVETVSTQPSTQPLTGTVA